MSSATVSLILIPEDCYSEGDNMELVENGLISVWDILVNRHGIAQESEYKPVFEQLEKTLKKSLLERIKHTEKICVLLVGNDKDLIRKIACLIYYYGDTLGFYYVDCLNEKSIEDTLSRFKRGTIFLENLASDLPLINRLNAKIMDFLNTDSEIRYKLNGAETVTPPQGRLIASVSDTNNLPEYFTSHFAIIMLEPERQITQKAKRAEKLFYNYDNPNKVNLFSKENKPITLTPTESKLFLFLVEDRRTPDEIIEHVWDVYKPKDIAKKNAKGNVKELRNRINNKCCKIGVENLISELTQKCYSLTVEVVER